MDLAHVIIIAFGVFLFMLWVKQRTEFFETKPKPQPHNATIEYRNIGPEIHERHPMQVSIFEDLKSKYKKAYNYELENAEYESALKKTFKVAQESNKVCIASNEWGEVKPVMTTLDPELQSAYKFAIEYIADTIKESAHFQLPDNLEVKLNQIQMLHDVLVSYQSHKRLPAYILTMQFVFYREAKYQAKDIGMLVRVDKAKGRYTIQVIDLWINGVIFEDKIGLFPVVPIDKANMKANFSKANFSDQHPSNYLKKGAEFCASNNLDEQTSMHCVDAIDMSRLDHNQVIL